MSKLTTQTPRQEYVLGLLLAIAVCMFLPYCNKPDPLLPGVPTVEEVSRSLKPDEGSKVVVGRTGVVNVSRDKTGKVTGKSRYLPPEGKTEVIVKNSGEVVVRVQTKGFTFRPGVGVGSVGGRVAPILDIKFAYWNRVGATLGTGLTKQTVSRPYGAVSYTVYNNTALFLGCSIGKDVVLGVRVSF